MMKSCDKKMKSPKGIAVNPYDRREKMVKEKAMKSVVKSVTPLKKLKKLTTRKKEGI